MKSELSVSIKKRLSSIDENRQRQPIETIQDYINTHGLAEEPIVCTLLERLLITKSLQGKEESEIEFLAELDNAITVSASLKACGVFSFGMKYEGKFSEKHSFKKKISVDFGQN